MNFTSPFGEKLLISCSVDVSDEKAPCSVLFTLVYVGYERTLKFQQKFRNYEAKPSTTGPVRSEHDNNRWK